MRPQSENARKQPNAHRYWHDFMYDASHWSWHDARVKGGDKRRYRMRCAPKKHRLRGDAA